MPLKGILDFFEMLAPVTYAAYNAPCPSKEASRFICALFPMTDFLKPNPHEQASLATLLRERRLQLGLQLKEIEYDTKIRPQYIQALEERDFTKLPVDLYLERIVQNYAFYLGLDAKVALKLLRMDKDRFRRAKGYPGSTADLQAMQADAEQFKSPVRTNFFVFTPRVIAVALAGFATVLIGTYLWWLVADSQAAPELTIAEPRTGVVVDSNNVRISGHSEAGSIVSINNLVVSVDNSGNFQETLYLQEGTNKVLVRAEDKGKISEKELVIEARIPERSETVAAVEEPGVTVGEGTEVVVKLDPGAESKSWVRVVADGTQVYEGMLEDGMTVEANKYVYLLAGNAAGVGVTLNGVEQGVLGGQGEVKHQVFGEAPPELRESEDTPAVSPEV